MRAPLAAACLAAAVLTGAAAAQEIGFDIPRAERPFLILDQDRLFTGSKLGREIISMNEAEARVLREENARIDRQFEEEERALTDRRPGLSADEFRKLADDFDARVVAARAAQDEKAQALASRTEQRRREFFSRIGPVLLQLLEETGAGAILEQRSVLISRQDLNITDEAIKRLDAAFDADAAQGRPSQGE